MKRALSIGVAVGLLWIGSAAAAERRLALIIANEDYPASIGRLTNTHEDAATMETALKAAGFSVDKVLDADEDQMHSAFSRFEEAVGAEAADGDEVIAFVYVSMHGAAAEVDGRARNFLLPAREEIRSSGELIRKAIRVDEVLSSLSATDARGIIMVSDACRNDLTTSFSKSAVKGFVPEEYRPRITLAYATAPGATTPDDGLFARTLAAEILKPGKQGAYAILDAIRTISVQRSMDGQPFMTPGNLPESFCFSGCGDGQINQDASDWGRALAAHTISAYNAYLGFHPAGAHADAAREQIAALRAESATEPTQDGMFAQGVLFGEPDATPQAARAVPVDGGGPDAPDHPEGWAELEAAAKGAWDARFKVGENGKASLPNSLFIFYPRGQTTLPSGYDALLERYAQDVLKPHRLARGAKSIRIVAACEARETDAQVCRRRAEYLEAALIGAYGVSRDAFAPLESLGRFNQLPTGGAPVEAADLNRYAMIQLLD